MTDTATRTDTAGPLDEIAPPTPTWVFWLPDEDRSTGWSNHTYVLQHVCQGVGDTPEQAWEHAKRRDDGLGVPEEFGLPERLTVIRLDAEINQWEAK